MSYQLAVSAEIDRLEKQMHDHDGMTWEEIEAAPFAA